MFSRPRTEPRPPRAAPAAQCSACASSTTEGGMIMARTVNSAWRKARGVARQFRRETHADGARRASAAPRDPAARRSGHPRDLRAQDSTGTQVPACQNDPLFAHDCRDEHVGTKAIFPVAGLGTRFLPATKAQPKEMLPVVDKPLIQYAVEEAYAAGVREMIFVTGPPQAADRRPLRHDLRARGGAGARRASRNCWTSCAASSPTTWSASTCARRRRWAWATRCCAASGWSATSPSRCCWPTT